LSGSSGRFQPNRWPGTWIVASNPPSLEDIPYTAHRRVNPAPNGRSGARFPVSALFKLIVLPEEIPRKEGPPHLQPVLAVFLPF
jgi:hypothetical protein